MRTYIKDLGSHLGEQIEISGFVEKFRDQKSVQFIVVRDVTGSVQVAVDKESAAHLLETTSKITTNTFLTVRGKAIENKFVKLGGMEVVPEEFVLESIAETLPIDNESNIDQKLDYRWIDLAVKRICL